VWISLIHWQKSAENGVGLALLAILMLKVLLETLPERANGWRKAGFGLEYLDAVPS
jgi:hypothetical protein